MQIKNRKEWMLPAFVFSLGILAWGLPVVAAENDEGVKRYGVVFDIAKDRKVENVGGLHQPEGLDKYIKRLTDDLGARITALEEAHQRTEQKVDQVLALLKEQKTKEDTASPNPPAPKVRNVFR